MSDQHRKPRVLFVCSYNQVRSRTAECIFRDRPNLDVRSAGTDKDARVRVSAEHLEWADVIFVMERCHRNILRRTFKTLCRGKHIVCLQIPDEYDFMEADLIRVLEHAVSRYLVDPALRPDTEP